MRRDRVGAISSLVLDRREPVHQHKSDEVLIAKIASGNRLAMQVLFARHHTRVYRFILRIVGEAATADDLTSKVFLAVWRNAHRFEGRSAAATQLLAVARHKALAATRRRPVPLSDGQDVAAREPATASEPQDDPQALFEAKRRGEILRACLMRLPREHREIMDLVYYHAKSMREVAEIAGIPSNTVRTRMFYARSKLAQLLAAQGGGPAP